MRNLELNLFLIGVSIIVAFGYNGQISVKSIVEGVFLFTLLKVVTIIIDRLE